MADCRGRALLGALAALACGPQAFAQSNGAVFGGVDVGRDRSAYLGATAPLGGSDGRWNVRAVLGAGDYDYDSAGVRIDGEYRQAELALVRSLSGAWGYLNLGAGARVTDTDLSPPDPGNDREGVRWDGLVSVDGVRRLSDGWEVGGYAAVGLDAGDYFVRAEATRAVSPRVRLGAEIVAQGDEAYDRQGGGLVVVFRPDDSLSWRGAVGERGGDAYVSLGLVHAY